jgi:hypothetical protein
MRSQSARASFARRKVDTRDMRPRILIACEGAKTEPNYFKAFRVASTVVDVRGLGCNTVSVVQGAREIEIKDGPFDTVWCVFDKDSVPLERFNNALQLARNYGYSVAYSNEAFELWYVLHFDYLQAAIPRADYITRLEDILGRYEKNDPTIYSKTAHLIQGAIRNADRLVASYSPLDPGRCVPSTTVHELVKYLVELQQVLS